MHKEGDGIASCEGASILRHTGKDGGTIYAIEGAVLDWRCDLQENVGLAGPTM